MKYKANIYVKDLLSIDYHRLKKQGIKCLLLDFDNTILERYNNKLNPQYEELFTKLKRNFKLIIVSNSIHKSKLEKFKNNYDIPYNYMSFKPYSLGFNRVEKQYNLKKEEICVIGDQVLTDVKGALKKGYYSILIDPINYDEHIFTRINRLREKKLIKRGNYYE